MNIYIARDGEVLGPYDEDAAHSNLEQGIFSPDDLGCLEGEDEWKALIAFFPPIEQLTSSPPAPRPFSVTLATKPTNCPAAQRQPQQSALPATLVPVHALGPTRQANGELAFYQDPGVFVTNARFIVSGQTYAMRNITSVHCTHRPAERAAAVCLMILGILLTLFFFSEAPAAGLLGLVVLIGACIAWMSAKDWYYVLLTTNAGQVQAVADTNPGRIAAIAQALNEAIIAHA